MRLNRLMVFCLCVTLLAVAAPTFAQDFRGRINGTVTDNTGAVLPGVTVTATSPALIQPQVQVTSADGDYRFLALPPGVYEVEFDLAGFQKVKREGVRVVINQTLAVDQQMQVATLQETVTVTGASPVVDTTTTSMGTNFTKELLTEIPNARDIWAAMSQAPGLQMTAYDVGGSHTGTQTGFLTYGFSGQNQTKLEGIDTTEGTGANAGYFDFGSFEEFQIGGAGSDASNFSGGASMSISVKSGGDRFSGNWYSDYENDATISDNVPDNLRVANTRDDNGYFVRVRAHARQPDRSPVRRQLERGRTAVEAEGVVLRQLAPERPVQVLAGLGPDRALEAVEQVHLEGHVPVEPEQPGHPVPEQARETAGDTRPRPDTRRCRRRSTKPRATTRGRPSGPACSAAARFST